MVPTGQSRPIEISASANFDLAAALVLLGRFDEAHSTVKAGLALNPIYAVSRVGALPGPAMSEEIPTYLVQIERSLEALPQGRECSEQ